MGHGDHVDAGECWRRANGSALRDFGIPDFGRLAFFPGRWQRHLWHDLSMIEEDEKAQEGTDYGKGILVEPTGF